MTLPTGAMLRGRFSGRCLTRLPETRSSNRACCRLGPRGQDKMRQQHVLCSDLDNESCMDRGTCIRSARTERDDPKSKA